VIENPEVRTPVIQYLLHRLEALIDGRRLIYVMDEFWKILDGAGGLKEFAKNKQKTIRKQNGLGIFATQSPEDALASDISAALVEQTATMILLPNPNASRNDYVDGLKLSEAEYQVVANLDERSRCFLVKQGHASTVCQLNLGGMDDEIAVISASTDNVAILHEVLEERAGALGLSLDQMKPEQWLEHFHARRRGPGRPGQQESRRDGAGPAVGKEFRPSTMEVY
jgi:type IV secretion system protein VirB4